MQFYDRDWKYIGTRQTLAGDLSRITSIETDYLTGAKDFRTACIAAKMSWMAGRTTTLVEDIAYSMLGIFGVTMPTVYGEGASAFMRLQEKLLSTEKDESIFAWRMPEPTAGASFIMGRRQDIAWQAGEWGLLAPSPEWFKDSGSVTLERSPAIERPLKGFEMTQNGLIAYIPGIGRTKSEFLFEALAVWSIVGWPLLYLPKKSLPAKRDKKDFEYPLKACIRDQRGNLALIRLHLRPISSGFQRIHCTKFVLGEPERAPRRGPPTASVTFQPTLGYPD
jgi:hypothetical protein